MQSTRRPRPRRGFTLLEVLLVLAILGVIAALVVPNLLGRQQEAYIKATRASVKGFEDASKLYAVEHDGTYPTADQIAVLWVGQQDKTSNQLKTWLDAQPVDAWKRPLSYEFPATGNKQSPSGKPAIWSWGPNGIDDDGANDDINNWMPILPGS